MKTFEFKLDPTVAQVQTINQWLDKLKWVWNTGLSLKLAGRQKYYREKEISDRIIPDGVVLQWKWRKVVTEDKKGKSTEKWEKVRLVGTGVIRPKSGHPYCEIRQHLNIENPDKYGQCEFYRSDNIPDFMADVPAKFKVGVIDSLKKSWKAYVTPKHPGRKPKFKGRNDKIKSLVNLNAGGLSKELKPEKIPGSNNGYVQFPKLGKIKVKGLFDRYDWQEWGSARIVKEPSGYYLHVCVDIPNDPLPKSDKAVGIDPGLLSVITTDQGREVEPPKLFRKQQTKLRRLQRKASRQQKGGCNQKKTYQKIALHHEKIRRSRNAFNHKLSTKVVREYSGIVMEDLKIQNLNRKPKAKKREDGNGYEQNGAKRKAGLNKSFADSALGDLISKIETKCKDTDREFVKVAAHFTTVDCSKCGAKIKKALSQRTHRCTECGHTEGRDSNAAKNILLKGKKQLSAVYRAWAWEHGETRKPGSDSNTECHQEGVQAPPEDGYSSQLNPERGTQRGRGDVKTSKAVKTTSKVDTVSNPNLDNLSITRAPYPVSISANSAKTQKPGTKKNKRSARSGDETFTQLTIWDTAGETGLGELS